MATLCTHCGAELPHEKARFCSNCGTPLSVEVQQPSAAPSALTTSQQTRSSQVLHEPIAQQPVSPPKVHEIYTEHSVPITPKTEADVPLVPYEEDDEDNGVPPPATPVVQQETAESLEDPSARPLATDVPLTPGRTDTSVPMQTPAPPVPAAQQSPAEIEQVATRLLDIYQSMKPVAVQRAATMQARQHIPSSRRRYYSVAVLLVLLVLIGVAVWAAVLQPFSVPAVTAPQQSFRDAQLGLALLYPNGWSASIDRHSTTVHFADSTHTAQVNITVANAAGVDALQYIVKEGAQLGLTGTQVSTALSFAGATWQQVQGSVQQNGASYTETVLVAIHNSHLFTLTQLAPQSTYAQEERLVFSSMRSSMHFL